jgi:hypothetical protein
MRGTLLKALRRFKEILVGITEAHVPLCVWVDFATLDLYKTHR